MKWQKTKSRIFLILLLGPALAFSQSTYFQQGSKENILLERLEIKAQKDTVLNFSFIKPFNRKWWVNRLEAIKADSIPVSLTPIDKYNIDRSLLNNMEWVTRDKENMKSKKNLWNTFYKTPANMIEVDQPDFFLSVNPVLNLQVMKESNNDEMLFLNTRGIVARGLIGLEIMNLAFLVARRHRQARGRAAVRVRGGGGVTSQRFGIADVDQTHDQIQRVNELRARSASAHKRSPTSATSRTGWVSSRCSRATRPSFGATRWTAPPATRRWSPRTSTPSPGPSPAPCRGGPGDSVPGAFDRVDAGRAAVRCASRRGARVGLRP